MRRKHEKKIRRSVPVPIQDFCADLIKKYAKNPHQDILRELWDNWDMVCPQEVYSLVKPFAYKGKTLFLGADNPVDLQEIRMYYAEILEHVNIFLDSYGLNNYFEKLEFSLIQGKKSLLERESMPEHFQRCFPPRPREYGGKIDFHGNKSLERCYEAYCNCLDLEEKLQKKN